MKKAHEEEFDGTDKAVIAGILAAFVVIGIVIGMALMYGWLAINGEIKSLTDAVEAVLLMAA